MTLRCNICSQNIEEGEVESHVNMQQHKDNKARISKIENRGSDASVVSAWLASFG